MFALSRFDSAEIAREDGVSVASVPICESAVVVLFLTDVSYVVSQCTNLVKAAHIGDCRSLESPDQQSKVLLK